MDTDSGGRLCPNCSPESLIKAGLIHDQRANRNANCSDIIILTTFPEVLLHYQPMGNYLANALIRKFDLSLTARFDYVTN